MLDGLSLGLLKLLDSNSFGNRNMKEKSVPSFQAFKLRGTISYNSLRAREETVERKFFKLDSEVEFRYFHGA